MQGFTPQGGKLTTVPLSTPDNIASPTTAAPVSGFWSKAGKWILRIALALLLFFLALAWTLQIPAVQQWAVRHTTAWLQQKLNTEVRIGSLRIALPGRLALHEVFVADAQGDTLLYTGYLAAQLQLLPLFHNEVVLSGLWLEDADVRILKNSEGAFNFDFITQAFAGEDDDTIAAVDTTEASAGMYIVPRRLHLTRVKAVYNDTAGGMYSTYLIEQLRAGIDRFSTAAMVYPVRYLEWHGGRIELRMAEGNPDLPKDTATEPGSPTPLLLQVAKAHLSAIDFRYQSPPDGMDMQVTLGNTYIDKWQLDLAAQHIAFGKLQLNSTAFGLQMYPPGVVKPPPAVPSPNWRVSADVLSLSNGGFAYDDQAAKPITNGMDYSHLAFSNLNLKGQNLYVDGADTVRLAIEAASLREKSGFALQELSTQLLYTPQGIEMANLSLVTPHTRISNYLSVGYDSPGRAAEDPGHIRLIARLRNAAIGHRDMLTVVPLLQEFPMFAQLPGATLRVNGNIAGTVSDLYFDDVAVQAFEGTQLRATGRLRGLPDPMALAPDLNVSQLTLRSSDLQRMIPEGVVPEGVVLPQSISAKGTLQGDLQNKLTTNLQLSTSIGNAAIKGFIEKPMDPDKAVYDLSFSTYNLQPGLLVGMQNPLGKITLQGSLKGKSFAPDKLTGQLQAAIEKVEINQQTLQNLRLDARANEGIVQGTFSSKDSLLLAEASFFANLRGTYPNVSLELALEKADVGGMGFTDYPLHLAAEVQAIFPRLDIERPDGSLFITGLQGLYDTLSFSLDTLTAITRYQEKEQQLFLKAAFLEAQVKGDYTLTGLVPELMHFLNQHYGFIPPLPALQGNQHAYITAKILPSEQLFQFAPGLSFTEPLYLKLDFDSEQCIFDLQGLIPTIEMSGASVQSGSLFAVASDTSLNYKLYLDEVGNEVFAIPTVLVQGEIVHNIIYTDVRLLDRAGRLEHTLAARIEHMEEGFYFHFDPNSVMLNYEPWGLDAGNELLIAPEGILANAFTFSNGSQALILQTWGDSPNDPLGIRLFNFEIGTFTSIARQDSLYLDGTINGTAEIKLKTEHLMFVADLSVEYLKFKKDTIGNITFKVNNETQDNYAVEAYYSGGQNNAELHGGYNSSTGFFDLNLDVEKLMLQTIEPFTMGYLNRMRGHMEGGISISGNMDKPVVIGNLLFRDAEANAPLLNSVFSLRNERIRFLQDGMHFRDFTLTDATGQKAVLNGTILTSNWLDYRFNLDFVANNFRVINSTRRDFNLLYGALFMDSRISFRGTTERPVVQATFRVNDRTDLTMVMPQEDPDIAERDGIIEFIDPNNPMGSNLIAMQMDSIRQTNITGLELNAAIEIDRNAIINFIIDEGNGDMLTAKGTGSLFGGIDPSGKITMTGTYELTEGSYETGLAMLARRKFLIQKGSTITWTGEPTTADVNVTAVYEVRVSPYDLVEPLIIGENPQVQVKYRDRLPFRVLMNMKGELLQPDITFDIELQQTTAGAGADMAMTINSRLEQLRLEQSEMNKQVFALILLNRFVADNPFASSGGGGSGVSAIARQSVSKLLADQLNALAGNLIEGVELNFGLNSEQDLTTGTGQVRTDFNVGISTKLLQDRLRITVGSNFELEGPVRPNEKTSNIAGNIQADYMLSRDGRYTLRAYRRDEYEVALQGQVVETGVTFIITMDFDTFREIFERRKAIKEMKRIEKTEEPYEP